jgi:hypothetical protein
MLTNLQTETELAHTVPSAFQRRGTKKSCNLLHSELYYIRVRHDASLPPRHQWKVQHQQRKKKDAERAWHRISRGPVRWQIRTQRTGLPRLATLGLLDCPYPPLSSLKS